MHGERMNGPLTTTCDVDVIIPVYNGAKYIVEALSSVVHQTRRPKRIIVVDDGSTDNTESVVRSYRSPVPVCYVKKSNGGPSSARNAGIAESDSLYIAFLDADDVWEPDKLQKQIAVFEYSLLPCLGVVYCNSGFMTAEGVPLQSVSVSYNGFRGWVFDKLIHSNITTSGSEAVVKRNCFEEAGLFDESLRFSEDWDMWLRIAAVFEFDRVDEKLVRIRIHDSNASKNLHDMIEGRILVLSKLLKVNSANRALLQELRYHVLRLIVHKRFRNFYPEIVHLLTPEVRKQVFSDLWGLTRAAWKGVKKLSEK